MEQHGVQEVGGSNPLALTNKIIIKLAGKRGFFVVFDTATQDSRYLEPRY